MKLGELVKKPWMKAYHGLGIVVGHGKRLDPDTGLERCKIVWVHWQNGNYTTSELPEELERINKC